MKEKEGKIAGPDLIKKSKPEKLHEKAKDFLFFQIYSASEYIYNKFGLEALKEFYYFNQESFMNINMSTLYKLLEGLIKKLPKGLKIKEGLKMFVNELQFMESPKNITILENNKEKATFEVTKCTLRKKFNKFAKKSKKLELIDKCCLWCMESTKFTENYGIKLEVEITQKGCLNYLT